MAAARAHVEIPHLHPLPLQSAAIRSETINFSFLPYADKARLETGAVTV